MPRKQYDEYRVVNRPELLAMRDEKIREEFVRLTKKKHLNAAYVIHEVLQVQFYLEPETLWQIVNGKYRGKYLQQVQAAGPVQVQLFEN